MLNWGWRNRIFAKCGLFGGMNGGGTLSAKFFDERGTVTVKARINLRFNPLKLGGFGDDRVKLSLSAKIR